MRFRLMGCATAVLLAWLGVNSPARAAEAKPETLRSWTIGFLPEADQKRVIAAHDKALVDNPKLKSEDEELREGWTNLRDATPERRMAFMEKQRSHDQKMRQAMLREDPTLRPILDQIDEHLSALRAERQRAISNGAGAP